MSEAAAAESAQAVSPDHLVALVACPWEWIGGEALDEIHAEHWQELATYTLSREERATSEEAPLIGSGVVRFEGDEFLEGHLWVEGPLVGMEQSVGSSAEPLTATEVVMLQRHASVWRVVMPGGRRLGRRGAKRMSQVLATLVEAGACAAFMPGLMRLHSPGFLRKQTMDLFDPRLLANVFVSAWQQEGWMRTRGLTAFGLPELEAQVARGVNAAYFDLMDVAANMLMQMAPYPDGALLELGPRSARLMDGASGFIEDEAVPINGAFGVQRVVG